MSYQSDYRPPPGAPSFPRTSQPNRRPPDDAHPPQHQQPIPDLNHLEAQYHEQLVSYYYSFATKGLLAPVSDPRQARARDEAVRRRDADELSRRSAVPPAPPIIHQRPNSWHPEQPRQQAYQLSQPTSFPSHQVQPRPIGSARPLPRPVTQSLTSSPTPPPSVTQLQRAPASWDEIGASLARRPITQSDVGISSSGFSGAAGGGASRSDVGMAPSPAWSEVGNVASPLNGSLRGSPASGTGGRRPPLPVPPAPVQRHGLPQPPSNPSPSSSSPSPKPPFTSSSPVILPLRPQTSHAGRPPLPIPIFHPPSSSTNTRQPLPPPPPPTIPEIVGPEEQLGKKMAGLALAPSTSRSPQPPSISFPSPSGTPPPRLHPRADPSHPSHSLYHPISSSSFMSQPLEAGTVTCLGCKKTMFGRALMAAGGQWHPDCFVCQEDGCYEKLEHIQFEERDDKVWCMVHFEEKFATTCFDCHTPIADDNFVTISDARLIPPLPKTRTYHTLHFYCASCGNPFVDPKSLSPNKKKEETEAIPYMVHKGYAYCETCDIRLWREKCRWCRKGIADEWVEPAGEEGGKWHFECFICSRCRKSLDGNYLLKDVENVELPQEGKTRQTSGPQPKVFCTPCYHLEAAEAAQRGTGM